MVAKWARHENYILNCSLRISHDSSQNGYGIPLSNGLFYYLFFAMNWGVPISVHALTHISSCWLHMPLYTHYYGFFPTYSWRSRHWIVVKSPLPVEPKSQVDNHPCTARVYPDDRFASAMTSYYRLTYWDTGPSSRERAIEFWEYIQIWYIYILVGGDYYELWISFPGQLPRRHHHFWANPLHIVLYSCQLPGPQPRGKWSKYAMPMYPRPAQTIPNRFFHGFSLHFSVVCNPLIGFPWFFPTFSMVFP